MKVGRSAMVALSALLLAALTSSVSSGAVSYVTFRKNSGVHGQSSTSYGIKHGTRGRGAARVEVVQSNKLGPARQAPLVPVQPQIVAVPRLQPPPVPLPSLVGRAALGLNDVVGGPLPLPVAGAVGQFGPLAGSGALGGPGVGGGAAGPVSARLVHPGGPLNGLGALDGPLNGPLGAPLDGPVGVPDSGPRMIRLRDDPMNRVGVNGRAPVQDSLPRPTLRTITGTPVWVPSFSNEPPSYEK